MTPDEALELARASVVDEREHRGPKGMLWRDADYDLRVYDRERKFAAFITEVCGAQMPCGYDEPRVVADGVDWGDITFASRAEALGIAAAITRAALSLPEGGE